MDLSASAGNQKKVNQLGGFEEGEEMDEEENNSRSQFGQPKDVIGDVVVDELKIGPGSYQIPLKILVSSNDVSYSGSGAFMQLFGKNFVSISCEEEEYSACNQEIRLSDASLTSMGETLTCTENNPITSCPSNAPIEETKLANIHHNLPEINQSIESNSLLDTKLTNVHNNLPQNSQSIESNSLLDKQNKENNEISLFENTLFENDEVRLTSSSTVDEINIQEHHLPTFLKDVCSQCNYLNSLKHFKDSSKQRWVYKVQDSCKCVRELTALDNYEDSILDSSSLSIWNSNKIKII